MALIRPAISVPRGLDKLVLNNQDFIPGKYSHGDLKSFAILIGNLQKKVIPLLDQAKLSKSRLQDLQNLALICEWVAERDLKDDHNISSFSFDEARGTVTLGPSPRGPRVRKDPQTSRFGT